MVPLSPHPIDRALNKLDGGFSTAVYTWSRAHPACSRPLALVYYGLPLALALLLPHYARPAAVLRRLALAAVLALPLYLLCPAVGPAHLGEPWAPRNCMPSLHQSWTLLLLLLARGKARWAALTWAALTAVATLSTGEHYTPDLAAAVPFAFAVDLLATRMEKLLSARVPRWPAPEAGALSP
jgi:hypothetical protein